MQIDAKEKKRNKIEKRRKINDACANKKRSRRTGKETNKVL